MIISAATWQWLCWRALEDAISAPLVERMRLLYLKRVVFGGLPMWEDH